VYNSNQYEFDKKIKKEIDENISGYYHLYIKIGYSEGKKVVRFFISSSKEDLENRYYETSYNNFVNLFKVNKIEKSNPVSSETPLKNVTNIDVKSIDDFSSNTLVKLPKEFDPNNAYMKSTFLFNSNLPSVPFGGMVFIHSNDISFFIDIKSNLKWRGELGVDINGWTEEPTQITPYSKIPMNSGSESYTQLHRYKAVDKGEVDHKRIINIGLAKTIQVDKTLNLKAYIGCGIYNTEKELITRIHEYEWTYYHWHYIQQNDWYDYNDLGTDYIIKKEYNTKLNVTGGLLFDFASGLSMGVGFDTNPGGINLSLGFNIGKH
jgi:hypothetical protein